VPSKQATVLVLILNELVVNAVKHAFAVRGGGHLTVRFTLKGGSHHLVVQDDGPGLTADFDLTKHANLGLRVVRTLVERDLDGRLRLSGGPGLTIEIGFP
jgi:two-component sensor histidine kinase